MTGKGFLTEGNEANEAPGVSKMESRIRRKDRKQEPSELKAKSWGIGWTSEVAQL